MYDVHSKCADDFINHEEILETLAYADENKENIELIDSIIEKAKKRKGLSHREASVLLACPIEEKNQEIYNWQNRSRKISTETGSLCLQPLYLSNYCSQRLHLLPRTMQRTNTSRENSFLRRTLKGRSSHFRIWGTSVSHWRPAKTAVRNTMDYYLKSIETIYSIKHKNGAIRPRKHQYCGNDCRQLPSPQRSRDRHIHPLPGDFTTRKAISSFIRRGRNTTTTTHTEAMDARHGGRHR